MARSTSTSEICAEGMPVEICGRADVGGADEVEQPMATLEECIDGLQELLDACIARAQDLRFELAASQQAAAMALLGTVLELAHNLVMLLRQRSNSSAKVILRSLLEAYVDLRNVTRDATYLKHLQAVQLDQDLRAFRESRKPVTSTNPYFRSFLANRQEAEKRAAECEAELGELKREGYGALTIRERFELAGELERYSSVYYLLCQDSHHNLKALERRHFSLEGGKPVVLFFAEDDVEHVVAEGDAVAGIVANAVADTSRLLDGRERDLDRIGERLELFRQSARALLAQLRRDEEE